MYTRMTQVCRREVRPFCESLDLVHNDWCRPIGISWIGNAKYIVTFMMTHQHCRWCSFQGQKIRPV